MPDSGYRRKSSGRLPLLSAVLTGLLALAAALNGEARPVVGPTVSVTTYHNDNARTGVNAAETQLSSSRLNPRAFGKLFTLSVDGYVYAQPLYLPRLTIKGRGTHNIVLIATEHDSVYAFDADSNLGANAKPLWHTSFVNPARGVTTVPNADVGTGDILPEIGITGTPVIDEATGTLYVVAKTREVNGDVTSYVQRLHAIDVRTGTEKFGGPVAIQANIPATGDGSVDGVLSFNALRENQRAGLALSQGVVYICWGSHGDISPYHGWVIGYDAHTLHQAGVFVSTPDGGLGGIWQSGAPPAVDAQGNLYLATGNGTFSADAGGADYGDSFLRLKPGKQLALTDYFTAFNQATLQIFDLDLGSGGLVVLPDQPGPHPHLVVGAGKEGKVYLLDRDSLGGFHAEGDHALQVLRAGGGAWSTPAFFNNTLYYGGVGDALKAFSLSNITTAGVSRPGGFSDTQGLQLNGSAGLVASAIRLTNDYWQAGSVFTSTPVNGTRFSTSFVFRMSQGSDPIADGITFTLQAVKPTSLGGVGGAMGYLGIRNSVAVKFDTYDNEGEGLNSTGIYTNGTKVAVPAVNLDGTGIDLHSQHPFRVNADYDGATLRVTITDQVTSASAQQSYPIDIPGALGGPVGYAGFTAGTGGLFALHDVQSWTYTAPDFTGPIFWPAPASQSPTAFIYPGATPSISTNGQSAAAANQAVVWAIMRGQDAGGNNEAVLRAFAAADLSRELYNSAWLNGLDDAGGYVKFTVPTVANGHVYLGGQGQVSVFGLLPARTREWAPLHGPASGT